MKRQSLGRNRLIKVYLDVYDEDDSDDIHYISITFFISLCWKCIHLSAVCANPFCELCGRKAISGNLAQPLFNEAVSTAHFTWHRVQSLEWGEKWMR
jgi:hypothetical protein